MHFTPNSYVVSHRSELLTKYIQYIYHLYFIKQFFSADENVCIMHTICSFNPQFCVHADKRQMLQELTRSLQQKPTQAHVLWELAGCICSAVGAEGYRLYLAEKGDPENLGLYPGEDERYLLNFSVGL
jgi:hypothetical protein